jgi:hypothetical protein
MKQAILIIMILAGAPVEATQPMTPFPALPSQQTLQQAEQKDSVSFPFLFGMRQTLKAADDVIIDPGGDDEDLIQPLIINDGLFILLIMAILLLLIKDIQIRKK